MNTVFFKSTVWWGFLLWFLGYVLGIVFFMLVPPSLIGWYVTPIGIAVTVWVLFKKTRAVSRTDFCVTGVIWLIIAVVFDYLFIVQLLKPEDGYYKSDVYLYYLTTLLLPVLIGIKKNNASQR